MCVAMHTTVGLSFRLHRRRLNNMKVSAAVLPSWLSSISEASLAENWPPRSGVTYDWEVPTQEAYYDGSSQDFVGKFDEARRQLDYSYHRHPARKRQLLQDSILNQVVQHHESTVLNEGNNHRRPWLVLSAGPMGVGKSYVLSKLHSAGYFPLDRFLKIDPDMIKSEIPESAGYMQANPATAATLLHGESTQMSDILFQYSLSSSLDMLVDGSLRDVDWYTDLIVNTLRKKHPQYRIAILHVTADAETIRLRAQQRAVTSGRAVPSDLLEESIRQVPTSVERLAPLVDLVYTISNNEGETMQLLNQSEKDTPGATWGEFAQSWRHDDATGTTENEAHHLLVCDMVNAWVDRETQEVAKDAWSGSYPSFCPRCAITCDGVCGICIHNRHRCSCKICNKVEAVGCT